MTRKLILGIGVLFALTTGGAGQHRLQDFLDGRRPWPPTSIARGAGDYANGPCIGCHAIDGVSTANKGINLTHEGSRRDPEWIRAELMNPTSPRPPIPDVQIDDLTAYLSSLK